MAPYKFANGTVYHGEWYVINCYIRRTVNPTARESTICPITRFLKECR